MADSLSENPRGLPDWVSDFPRLNAIDDDVWESVARTAEERQYPMGTTIVETGASCSAFLLVRSGQIRLVRRLENGREIAMYRLSDGSSCSATTALLLAGGTYSTDIIADDDVSLVFLPKQHFRRAFEDSRPFREYVCQEFCGRIQQLVNLLESVMLRNVGERLAQWLLDHADPARDAIESTHQAIAADLGTAREVVSRHLKHLETRGCVSLARGSIRLLDTDTLATMASGAVAETPLAAPPRETDARKATSSALLPNAAAHVQIPEWTRVFDPLHEIDDEAWRYVAGRAKTVDVDSGTQMFSAGDVCSHYVLVLEGCIKVYRSFGSGREFVLYRLQRGDTCCATTSVLLGGDQHVTDAIAETDASVVLISKRDFDQAFHASKGFRDFVLATYGGRVQQLILLLESVMAQNVEVRLARCVLERAGDGNKIEASHGELAVEVGTAREVVSRKLQQFQRDGLVSLDRRLITIVDRDALRKIEQGGSYESDFVTNF